MEIKITVSGLNELRQRLRPLTNPTWIAGAVEVGGRIIGKGIRERYDAEVTPDYTPWAPLKSSTLKRKGGRGKMLVQTGSLRSSIRVVGVNQYAVKLVAADHPGKFHQSGTTKMVARPFMGISSKDETKVMDMMERRLKALL